MKLSRSSVTLLTAIGTAAVVSTVTTAIMLSGGSSHPSPTVNAHLSDVSISDSPTPTPSPTATDSATPTPAAPSSSTPAALTNAQPPAAPAQPQPTTAAPDPDPAYTGVPVPVAPKPSYGPVVGDSCSSPGASMSSPQPMGPQAITCGTDNQWHRTGTIYPGAPCAPHGNTTLTVGGLRCGPNDTTWH